VTRLDSENTLSVFPLPDNAVSPERVLLSAIIDYISGSLPVDEYLFRLASIDWRTRQLVLLYLMSELLPL
jgi:hypothetical protein